MIHQLKANRLNHSQIARWLNLDGKTVRRYLSSEPSDTAIVGLKVGRNSPVPTSNSSKLANLGELASKMS